MWGSQEGFCFNRDAATLLLIADVMAAIISRPRWHIQGTGVTPALMPADAYLIQTIIGLSHSDGHEIAPLTSPAAGSIMGGSAASPLDPSLHHFCARPHVPQALPGQQLSMTREPA